MEKVYGVNPVKIILRQKETGLTKIYVSSGRGGAAAQEIIDLARQKNVPVEVRPRQYLDELTANQNHQGFVGLTKTYSYSDLDTLIANRNKLSKFSLVLILDSVVDPQNLGSIIRSAYCMGANGVIIPSDRAASITATVVKASAGSVLQMPVARETNLSQTIKYLKEKGFWVFGAEANGGQDPREADFNCHVALLLGGEAKGIRPLLKKQCDFLLSIPMAGKFDSLNVAVAAGIIQYEIFCRRNQENIS
ncbi:MAG: 23S rRNA (guanosine(2251)-2'-O)-methyltransferase RlmB [Syntrophaceae bacterium]|nr:23S rRNA (guanosine(2251)-2'-O)-methyltransferase RlmB [Syntrophaceae bacterium]